MANTVLTSVLGVAFWLVAARLFSKSAVGRDSALISAMMGISVFCQLNLNNALIRFLPVTRRYTARVVALAYAVTALASAAVAVGFVLLVPRWSSQLRFLSHDHVLAAAFCIALPLWAVFTLQDSALTAFRRAPWVALENTAFGLIKLAALPVLLVVGIGHAIFLAWTGPVVVIVVAMNLLLFGRAVPAHLRAAPERETNLDAVDRPALARFLALDYLAWSLTNGFAYLLPVLVVALLGDRSNASFYIAYTVSASLNMLFINAATSLTVEGAMAEQQLAELTRRLVRRVLPILLLGVAVLTAAAPIVLLPFGGSYAASGANVLRLLAIATVFRAVVILYSAVARVRGHGRRILAANVSLVSLLVVGTVVLGERYGLVGIGVGWLAAHVVVAAALVPSLSNLLRRAPVPAFSAAGTPRPSRSAS
jgi:O-antigen/teichoic acid export membrane protein